MTSTTPLQPLRAIALPCAMALALSTALQAQSITASIARTNGSVVRGAAIATMTYEEIKYSEGGNEERLLSVEVSDVEWNGMPGEYAQAGAFAKQGKHLDAANLFAEAAGKTSDTLAKLDTEFRAAHQLVLAAQGAPDLASQAVSKMSSFVSANSEHFRIPQALLSLGMAQRLAGEAAASVTTLKRLETEATERGYGLIWTARARYQKALAHLDNGEGREARSAFQSAASAAENGKNSAGANRIEMQNLKLDSLVGEGETWLREENISQAREYFQRMARNAPAGVAGEAVRAAALAGEGEALYQDAVASKNTTDLRRAQLALAEANVMDTLAADTSAKSAYYLGLVTMALGAEGGGDSFKSRARAYLQSVVKNHPTSRWAGKARKQLEG